MTVHNYRSRQVHETLNGVNPSSGFRDMRSAKSGPNLYQIWQVFGQWASLYGANGQMTMTVHNYRPRQFHRTSNGENPSSGYRDMGSASLAAARPAARPPGPWRQYPSSPEGWGVKKSPCDRRAYITQYVRGKCTVQTPTATSMRGLYAACTWMIAAHTRMYAAHTRMIATPAQDIDTLLLKNVKFMLCVPYQFAQTRKPKPFLRYSYAIF